MKKIVLDENYNVVDELAERNEEIKRNLDEILKEFLDEKDEMKALKKAVKLGYRFSKQLYLELSKYPLMTVEEFVELDYDTTNEYWLKYLELTAYYNRYFEIVDNKQLLQRFMGINSRQYSQLEKHSDEDIRNLMNTINSAFVGLGFMASESGNADVKATSTRLRASGEAGHGVVSAVEEKVLMQDDGMDEKEELAELARLGIKVVGEDRRLK